MLNVSFLQELMNAVAEQSRSLLPKALFGAGEENAEALAGALMSGRGEASGVAIARQLLGRYRTLTAAERSVFFRFLSRAFEPDAARARAAAEAYARTQTPAALAELQKAVESPRLEFFRRLNLAPGATAEIVAMRRELLEEDDATGELAAVDADLRALLQSWFNRGFLVLRRIDWQTPAAILEKIIAYEAVHEIRGWDDLRRRLDPHDRRCFAFFHPSLIDEPLIFVEVALTRDIPAAISPLLTPRRDKGPETEPATTAVFYSISNCQEGLKGISFGNFLLKQVVEDLTRELPGLTTFVTLSPVPRFARWLDRAQAAPEGLIVTAADLEALAALADPRWVRTHKDDPELQQCLLGLASHYFLEAKSADGRPVDPVARFHLGNGARLERVNWLADTSEKGLTEAHGLMVNYCYELKDIERNHEAYANDGIIAASRQVRALMRPRAKAKTAAPAASRLSLTAVKMGRDKAG